ALTDSLDGYLARKYHEVTEFGKIIDPLADKVIIGIVIIKLFLIGEVNGIYLVLILSRDILIFLGGIFVAQKINKILPSNILGKITVTNIGLVIFLIIINVNKDNILFEFFYKLSIALIIISIIGYAYRAIEFVKKRDYGNI
ncbi:MAG: CDP-alcohol phosphatidyltransferase family protein, partial [Actinobacteria bacterium]|nr:CDP-alcohol phosphatidyltransferase family protein [Actinomycetota bacterium]